MGGWFGGTPGEDESSVRSCLGEKPRSVGLRFVGPNLPRTCSVRPSLSIDNGAASVLLDRAV